MWVSGQGVNSGDKGNVTKNDYNLSSQKKFVLC